MFTEHDDGRGGGGLHYLKDVCFGQQLYDLTNPGEKQTANVRFRYHISWVEQNLLALLSA